jgi:hypothetical protein
MVAKPKALNIVYFIDKCVVHNVYFSCARRLNDKQYVVLVLIFIVSVVVTPKLCNCLSQESLINRH